jgi:dTDP-4-dehydrorhamnose reductase
MPAPVLVVGRRGQLATALQRLGPVQLRRPLLAVGRPELDLAQPAAALTQHWADLLERHQPALVINAAAYTAVDRAETELEQAMAANGYAVGAMARGCGQQGIPFVHLSTDYVFAGNGEVPWRPADLTEPLGVYGASKLLGEQLLRQASEEVSTQALVLRVSWVFGQQGNNFVRTMLRLAPEREELRVVADQVGGPTSAEAIAAALLQLLEPAIANRSPVAGGSGPFPWGIHHFQGQPWVSWHGFAEAIVAQALELGLLERKPEVIPITTAEFPTPAVRPANSRLDCSSSAQQLGLVLPAWREDLRQCLCSWRSAVAVEASALLSPTP